MMRLRWLLRLALITAILQLAEPVATGRRAAAQEASAVRVDFEDADLRAVLSALAELMGANITYGQLPSRTVTLKTYRPVPLDSLRVIFMTLLDSNELYSEERGGVMYIAQLPQQQDVAETQTAATAAPRLFVIRLKHAYAVEAAAVINALLGRGPAAMAGGPSLSGVGLSAALRDNLVPPGLPRAQGQPALQGQRGTAQVAAGAGEEAEFEGEVTIVPDVTTNSLLVRATPHDFEVLRSAVEKLDVRPRQVMIEVLIAEARRDALTKIGMEIFASNTPSGSDPEVSGVLSDRVLGNLAVEIMHLGNLEVRALFEAISSSSEVRILSRPVLVTVNNQEAHILVGSERPFIQVARALPTDAGVRDQVVQYRDVGTKLSIIPTINYDGYVTMTLRQEVSVATSEFQFGAPVISSREVTTRLMVKNGQTVVIGGLIDRQRERVRSGVPLLKDLPLIGALFGSSSWRTVETELFLFLTPHVLETDADAEAATKSVWDAAPRIRDRVPEPLLPPDTLSADSTATPEVGTLSGRSDR